MGKKIFFNDDLHVMLLSVNESEVKERIETWLTENEIEFHCTANMQYKILNGCVPNIMFYPSTHKLMIQDKGKNYVQTARSDTILAVIKGDIPYKKAGE